MKMKCKKKYGYVGDFEDLSTLLEELVCTKSHICLYLPKYHCELRTP